jgi:hypothetical protein
LGANQNVCSSALIRVPLLADCVEKVGVLMVRFALIPLKKSVRGRLKGFVY